MASEQAKEDATVQLYHVGHSGASIKNILRYPKPTQSMMLSSATLLQTGQPTRPTGKDWQNLNTQILGWPEKE